MKKLIALLLVVVMALTVFAACTPADNNPTDPPATDGTKAPQPTDGDENPTDAPSTGSSEKTYDEHISFTISAIDAASLGMQNDGTESAVWTYLKDKFNFEFSEVWPLEWGNFMDVTRTWLATGSAPDLMMIDIPNHLYNEFLSWVDAGLLAPYKDYENYPNLKLRMDGMSTGKQFIVDGELMAWPAYLDNADFNYSHPVIYIYRTDWAKDVGLYQEDGVYTWDEWWALLDAIKDAAPAGADTIPLVINSDYGFPERMTLPICQNMFTFVQQDDGTWVWGATLPETTEALEFTKEKYDAGIIYKDQPITGEGVSETEFAANHLFASLRDGISTDSFMGGKSSYEEANPGAVYEDIFEIASVIGNDGVVYTERGIDQWSQTIMNVNMTDAQIERWMDILDYLASDEGYYVRNYGIPGTDWEYNEDGKAVCLWTPNEDGTYSSPYQGVWPWARIAGCNDNFSNYSPNYPAKVQDMVIRVLELFGGEDVVEAGNEIRVGYFSDPDYADATAGLELATWGKIHELIIEDDFIEQWNAWVAEKNVELQPAIDALNAAFPD